jgi:AraC-like DNA-binding protein
MEKRQFSTEKVFSGHLRVNSCGKQWLGDGDYETVRENGRVDFSLYYILKGRGYCHTEEGVMPVSEGSLILYFPNVRQHYSFKAEDKTVMLWSHFSGEACAVLKSLLSDSASVVKVTDRMQLESCFDKMIIAHYERGEFSEEISRGYMDVCLSLIAKSLTRPTDMRTRVSNEKFENALSLMNINFAKPIDIKEYARICCVCEDHFIRIFKAYSGVTPYQYQLRIRIERAAEMLENGGVTVAECGEAVGFNSHSYFCRIFKKMKGVSPTAYRKR